MNKSDTHSAKLSRSIAELERQGEIEKTNFITGYHQLLQSLKPRNLFRAALEKIRESPRLRAKVITGIAGFVLAAIAKKMIGKKLEKSHSPREQERINQASKVVAPISKVLKPILSILLTNLLERRKGKDEQQHS